MEGLDQLKHELMQKAKKDALLIREEGAKKVEDFLEKKKAEANSYYAQQIKEVQEKYKYLKSQKKAEIMMNTKKEILAIKQGIIAETFNSFKEELLKMGQEEKLAYYKKLLKEALAILPVKTKIGERRKNQPVEANKAVYMLTLRAEDRELFRDLKTYFASLSEYEIELSSKNFISSCGLMLSLDNIHIDKSIDLLLKEKEEELSMQIAGVYFA